MTDSLIRRLTPPQVIYCCAHCSKVAKVLSTISHNHSHKYFLVWRGSVKAQNYCPAKLPAIRYCSHCMQLQPAVSHHNSEAMIHIRIEVLSQTTSTSCRPDWSRCANYVEGGTPRWAKLSDGRSSDQMVNVLLAQIAGVDVSEIVRDDTFQGQVC